MKITATQYAKSLYEATKDKSQSEIGIAMENFVKILAKNNHLKFKENIIVKFEEIYNKENDIILAEITSMNELEDSQLDKIKSFIKEKYKAKEVIIKNKVDKNIQGGIIIKVGDEVLDGSVERQLITLKKVLNK
jgi:F-type H+-transporting ATPase subunit delta